jgi:hypothetical protein
MQTVEDFARQFATDEARKVFLVAIRWPNGVRCPRCGNAKV